MHSVDAVIPPSVADAMAECFNNFHDVIDKRTPPSSPRPSGDSPEVAGDYRLDKAVVHIADLCRTGSPRSTGIDLAHVRRLVEAVQPLPPIVVHRPTMQVIDGFHRVAAAVHMGRTEVEAYLFDGPPEAAFILAVSANVSHGLPLSLPDRRAAATRILATRPALSDRAVASATGLSAKTVAGIRTTSADVGLGKRLGKDGRLRPLNAAAGRALAAQLMETHPDASLRQIAAAAGVSPGTVRDVRARLTRGEGPSPAQRTPHPEATQSRTKGAGASAEAVDEPVEVLPVLLTLSKDPALRMNASGRALLRWLHQHAINTADIAKIADDVPDHCVEHLIEVATRCATNWTRVARELNQRQITKDGSGCPPIAGPDDDLRTG